MQNIRKNTETNHLPIIVLTTKKEFPEVSESLNVPDTDYLIKPFKTSQLETKLVKTLTSSGYHAVSIA